MGGQAHSQQALELLNRVILHKKGLGTWRVTDSAHGQPPRSKKGPQLKCHIQLVNLDLSSKQPLCFPCLSIRSAFQVSHIKFHNTKARLWVFLQSPYTTLPCRKCQQFQHTSHCSATAIHSRVSLVTRTEKHPIYKAQFKTLLLPFFLFFGADQHISVCVQISQVV